MKKLSLTLLISLGLMVGLMSSCDEDEPEIFDRPTITAPTAVTEVAPEGETTITFQVTTPGGYASSTVQASSGTAEVTAEPATGAESGNVEVTYTAPATVGASIITLTVTDEVEGSDQQSATVQVAEEPESIVDVFASPEGVGTTTWTANNTYILRGFIFVNEGQTLTIEPGTIIKGQPGQGSGASALIVARGGTISAVGTAENPIIFTGLADDLEGSIPDDANALWGGIIILGNGPTNNVSLGNVKAIEGIPTEEQRGLYGGGASPNPADNSGTFQYVSIRHGGSLIGANNEINGLTLGAVGNGTTIDHVEIWSNLDDGIEFFGGTVNVSDLVVAYPGDDGIDIDEGYTGNIQRAIVWHTTETLESGDPRGMELDGGASADEASMPFATPNLANLTLVYDDSDAGSSNLSDAIYMRDNFGGSIYNSIAVNHDAPIDLERRTDILDAQNTPQSSYDRLVAGDIVVSGNILFGINGVTEPANIAQMFELSDEPDAALEAAIEEALAVVNTIVNPGLGTGATKFTPSAAAATENITTVPEGLETLTYKGAVDPSASAPYFANWSKTWSVINQ